MGYREDLRCFAAPLRLEEGERDHEAAARRLVRGRERPRAPACAVYAAQCLAVAGVGCAGVAVWLYLRQRSTPAEPDSAHAARLMLTPTASGIGITGRF